MFELVFFLLMAALVFVVGMWFGRSRHKVLVSRRPPPPPDPEVIRAHVERELESKVAQRTADLSRVNADLIAQIEQENKKSDSILESQAFLDSVVENIPNMIFVKDATDLRFIRFNRAGEEMLNARREDLLGKSDFDLFPAPEAQAFTLKDRDVLNGSQVIDIVEEPITTPKGVRVLHTKKIPVFDKNRKPLFLLGISEDITERKEAEAQRVHLIQEQAARELAESSLEQMEFLADASQALSSSLNYKETLPAFAQIVIHRLSDSCSIDLIEEGQSQPRPIVSLNRDPLLMEKMKLYRQRYPINWDSDLGSAKVLKTGRPELYHLLTDDMLKQAYEDKEQLRQILELKIHSAMIVPLVFAGKTLGTMSFASNRADRLFGSLDLSVAMDLAKRVSFAVENAQLYEKAQDANRAKSAFLANMSHEIRTPLGAMIGFAELIRESAALSSDQSQSADTIIRNGKQLLRIVDEILDISKVESERINIESIPFSLFQVIEDVRSLLKFQAEAKSLQLIWKNAPDLPPTVVSDPTRLRQILLNVIGNAIKFTEAGSVQVETSVAPLPSIANRVALKFEVTDSGVGISPEQEARLFQPFAQADSSMTRKFGGTGLGLYLSKKLAQVLGGDLALKKSALGKGSVFEVSIRPGLPPLPISFTPSTTADSPRARDQRAPLAPFRVLVVDDAPDNRILVGRMIKSLGGTADLAENGLVGVQKALQSDYDLVLMDIQMPEMDGFEALSQLKQKDYHRPVIALTAHAMKGDRELCLSKGFDHYLVKPIDRDALRETISFLAGK